ncbi:MAG TPA: FkbM family methyltransferase [Candidatus Babeliales bacterium]|nr:FkbM family methyltransferase [Candidatus Babeliales bacterium]
MQKPIQLRYITKEFIAQFLPENPVILEAGAHKGKDTLALHAQWPQSTIHAFEPVPHLYEKLQSAVCAIPSIYCYQVALSDHIGISTFYESTGKIDAASSLLAPHDYFNDKPIQFTQIEVPTTTIDSWAQENNIQKIDCLWLDLQGGELNALKAATSILPTVKAIHTEANLVERYKGSPLYNELKEWLESYGFELVAESFYHGSWGNVLMVKGA